MTIVATLASGLIGWPGEALLEPGVTSGRSGLPTAALSASTQQREEAYTLQLISQLGGRPAGIAGKGNHLYVGVGRRLFVLDISDREAPHVVGQSDLLPASIKTLRLSENGYVVADLIDGYAASTDERWQTGLWIIDVTDAAQPRVVGHMEEPSELIDLALEGDRGYGVAYDGLKVIDFADPQQPRVVGTYQSEGDQYTSIAVAGQYLYLGRRGRGGRTPGLRVIEVSNAGALLAVAVLPTAQEVLAVAMQGEVTFLYAHTVVTGSRRYLYVVDISDPRQPREVGQVDVPKGSLPIGWSTRSPRIAVDRGYAYILDPVEGLAVIDVTDPALPRPVHPLDGVNAGTDIAFWDQTAFISTGESEVKAIDVEDPSVPTPVAAYRLPNAGDVDGIAVDGDRAFLMVSEDEPEHYELRVVDVANRVEPRLLGTLALASSFKGVYDSPSIVAARGFVYLLAKTDVVVVDVSDPSTPRLAATFHTPGEVYQLRDMERYGLIADGSAGLLVVELSNPLQITEVAALPLPHVAREIVVSGGYAFVIGTMRATQPLRRQGGAVRGGRGRPHPAAPARQRGATQ